MGTGILPSLEERLAIADSPELKVRIQKAIQAIRKNAVGKTLHESILQALNRRESLLFRLRDEPEDVAVIEIPLPKRERDRAILMVVSKGVNHHAKPEERIFEIRTRCTVDLSRFCSVIEIVTFMGEERFEWVECSNGSLLWQDWGKQTLWSGTYEEPFLTHTLLLELIPFFPRERSFNFRCTYFQGRGGPAEWIEKDARLQYTGEEEIEWNGNRVLAPRYDLFSHDSRLLLTTFCSAELGVLRAVMGKRIIDRVLD